MAKIKLKGMVVTRESSWLYKWLGIDCIAPNMVENALKDAGGEDVELEIASNGGYVTAAIDIYQMLRDYEGKVTARISYACSAATIIACAADESTISEVGFFMIHNAQSVAEGDKHDMAKEGKVLNTIDQGIISAYERKTGMSRKDIQSLMSKDTYMSAQEAIEKGFVDGLTSATDDAEELTTEEIVMSAAAAVGGLIPEDKALMVIKAIKAMGDNEAPDIIVDSMNNKQTVQIDKQISGNSAGTDIKTQEGGKIMGLKEIMAENPEISNEIDELKAEAKAQGAAEERARIKSLDEISANVTPEMLNDAKYGENPIDGPALAYKAMKENAALAATYMKNAIEDSNDSNISDVGIGEPDVGEQSEAEKTDAEAAALAEYVNKQKGGR